MTLNDHWGYCEGDDNHKSTQHLVHLLARSASAGSNYLLNVGPTKLGEIVPAHAQRLREMGAWLKVNGEAIYGTRAGAFASSADSVFTRNGDTHYVHALNYVSDSIKLKDAPKSIQSATLLRDGAEVMMAWQGDDLVLTIPPAQRDAFDTVVKLA